MSNSKLKYYPSKIQCNIPGCCNTAHVKGTTTASDGSTVNTHRAYCYFHHSTTYGQAEKQAYLNSKGGCENRDGRLGFVCGDPNTPSLELDHIDGNRYNTDPSNHQILCSNCHRRKTKQNGDHRNRYTHVSPMFNTLFTEKVTFGNGLFEID